MKRYISWGLVLLFIALTSGCKKENRCKMYGDFPDNYEFVGSDAVSYCCPSFNPSNPDEFCLLTKTSPDSSGIFIYDMLSKQLRPVYIGKVWESPKWGKQGWLVFGVAGQLFKIRDDGAGITQLTYSYGNYDATWDSQGENIVFRQVLRSSGAPYSVRTMDSNGAITDSILGFFIGRNSWSEQGIIAAKSHSPSREILFLSSSPLSFIKSITVLGDGGDYITDLQWIPGSQKVVFTTALGEIYVTDYETEVTALLYDYCESHFHSTFSVNNSGTKLLTSATIRKQNDVTKTIDTYGELHMLNLDGSGEQRILPPN